MSATTSNPSEYAVINPATEEVVVRYDAHSDADLGRLLELAGKTFEAWRRLSFPGRAERFFKVAALLRERQDALAHTMAIEMGKPLAQGKAEAVKCAFVCEYFAEHAESFLAPRSVETELKRSEVIHRPLGTVFAIMPWNFPLWQVFRAAAPNLMAGNTMVLKHAPRVAQTALEIEKMMLEAGFPAGALVNVFATNEQAEGIIAHPAIKGVCLTGSGRAGRAVAATAGRHLKRVLLELGGSDPYVVLEDADLQLAAEKTVFSRMLNNGQTCISAKRFIVVESVAAAFTERVLAELEKQVIGNPLEEGVTQGPMARADLCEELQSQVDRSVAAGARISCGGRALPGQGYFFPATLLTGVRPGMAAFDEELFGPVGSIIQAKDSNEAIALANQSPYGLGAAIFTQDTERGLRIAADEIFAGTCVVNDFVRSDPRLPFGGIAESGFGRELGEEGIKEFVNIKTICLG
jgi:succinate-semialdehyde dehydrogenase/glutarate-semialdehyde dehydrogenase